jgi:hypothetical protein
MIPRPWRNPSGEPAHSSPRLYQIVLFPPAAARALFSPTAIRRLMRDSKTRVKGILPLVCLPLRRRGGSHPPICQSEYANTGERGGQRNRFALKNGQDNKIRIRDLPADPWENPEWVIRPIDPVTG